MKVLILLYAAVLAPVIVNAFQSSHLRSPQRTSAFSHYRFRSVSIMSTIPTRTSFLTATSSSSRNDDDASNTAPQRLPRSVTPDHMHPHNRNGDNDTTSTSISSSSSHSNKPSTVRPWTRTVATALGLAGLAATLAWPHTAMADVATAATTASSSWFSSIAETGFYQAFSLVFVSELGDKTFFMAGLLAMKTSRLISFVGSVAALAAMTVVSVVLGQVFHTVPTGWFQDSVGLGIPLDDLAAVLAFLFFGLKTLSEALAMDDGSSSGGSGVDGESSSKGPTSAMDEEFAEAEEAVAENESVFSKNTIGQLASIFGLVFAAEFGDRSFLSTIALSAAQNPVSVCGGAVAAHAVATGVAVAGGSVVAKYLSERVIGLLGGTLFLVFAVTTALGIF